jgi:hypothetical protein
MPYTTALKDVPRLPAAPTPVVGEDRTPTPEYYSLLVRIIALLETHQAALDELEP